MPTILDLVSWTILAQDGGGEGEGEAAAQGGGLGPLLMLFAMITVLYVVMMVLPQRREQRKAQEMLDSLKKNDRVEFGGGIQGTIVSVQQDGFVSVRVDESNNTKMRVRRAGITRIINDSEDKEEKESSK